MKKIIIVLFVMFGVLVGCESEQDSDNQEISTITITFEENGGDLVDDVTISKDKTFKAPTDVNKEGFEFGGWYTDEDLTKRLRKQPDSDITLYAKWDAITYYLIFVTGDGEEVTPVKAFEGESISLPETSIVNGTFLGWSDYGSDDLYEGEFVMPGKQTYLYAVYDVVDEFTIGLVTDFWDIDDGLYTQIAWESVLRFANDYSLPIDSYSYLKSDNRDDYLPNISAFSESDTDLIILPGFLFNEALMEASYEYSNQNFLVLDLVVDAPNVASVLFAENEGSFLAGVAAALRAKEAGEDTVGYIGGMDFFIIQKFEAGFEAGVWAVDPNMTVLVDYAGSFADPQMGQVLAAKQFDEGAYVIYHTSGGTANGIIEEAKDRRLNGEEVWVIGVDVDQYADGIYDGDNSVILTSMVKNIDLAVYDFAVAAFEGNFSGGEITVYNLVNNGVGLPAENPNLSTSMLNEIQMYREGVINGTYVVPITPSRLQ